MHTSTLSGIKKSAFILTLLAMLFLDVSLLFATHFRYGHLTWVQRPDIAPNTAEFILVNAFRRNGYSGTAGDGFPAVGDVITEFIGGTRLLFGDGTSTPVLQYKVISIDPVNNWLLARALDPNDPTRESIIHTYSAPLAPGGTPWVAQISSCCRIGFPLQNCVFCGYRVQTEVRFDMTNSSPVSSLTPIVNAPINQVFSFLIPAIDNDGDSLSWRFATSTESAITDPIGPAGGADATHAPTIDPVTGLFTWNTTGGTSIGNLFTTQVIIEEFRGGVQIGRVAVDFLLEIVTSAGNPPVCQITPPGPFVINENQALSFTVTGTDPDAGDVITLNTGGLPPGATMTPPLPLSGPNTGVSSTFNWTPAPGQAGSYVVFFTVTDNSGQQSQCSVNITVNPPAPTDTDPPTCALAAINPGPPINIDVAIQDVGSGLASINVLHASNATVTIPSFTPGTNDPVIVNAAKIDNSQGASVALEAFDMEGNRVTCDPVTTRLSANIPTGFALKQNYPNPFNPTTTIHFDIAGKGAQHVSLRVFDLNGQEVKTLVNDMLEPGQYAVEWDGTNNHGETVAGGVYIYRMVVGDFVATRKMILLK